MNKEHSKRKHATFAPSASDRWLECPGSVELSRKAPPQVAGPYAEEGTNAHECLEFIVKRFGNPRVASLAAAVKREIKDGDIIRTERRWNDEMISHALNAASVIMDLRPSKLAKLLVEQRSVMSKDVYGSLDYAWVDEWGELIVIDYKYGAGVPVLPVDDETGEENSQLMCYAVGIAKKYNYEFDSVTLAIIQPRVWKDDENPLSKHTTTVKRLHDFEKKANEAVAAAKKPGAKLAHGDHCRWCPAAALCPQTSKVQMELAGVGFTFESEEISLPEVELIAPKNMGAVLKACDLLEVWIEKVRAQAFQSASKGEKIDGWKLVNKHSTRKWLPEAEAQAGFRLGPHAFKTELLSPAQLEKKFGKQAKEFTEQFTTNESSGYTLVKLSDKRPEVSLELSFDVEES